MKIKQLVAILIIALTIMPLFSNAQTKKAETKAKVTFIELGSVRCIPCQKMEKVLDSIREIYPEDVKVIFHDVWTKKGKPYSYKYHVKTIPTQVFIGEDGKVFYRHEGYFSFGEVKKILLINGVTK